MNWLENGEVLASIGEFLAEDIGRGDITTTATVPADTRGVGRFLAKEDLVLCGIDVAEAVFFHLDPESCEIEIVLCRGRRDRGRHCFCDLERIRRCSADRRTYCPESDPTDERYRDAYATIC